MEQQLSNMEPGSVEYGNLQNLIAVTKSELNEAKLKRDEAEKRFDECATKEEKAVKNAEEAERIYSEAETAFLEAEKVEKEKFTLYEEAQKTRDKAIQDYNSFLNDKSSDYNVAKKGLEVANDEKSKAEKDLKKNESREETIKTLEAARDRGNEALGARKTEEEK